MDNFDILKWSTIEINVGIACACMPTIRLMLQHFFPGIMGTTVQRSTMGNSSSRQFDSKQVKSVSKSAQYGEYEMV
jgi:hypothetical protein